MTTVDIADRFRRIVEEGIGRGDESVLKAYVAQDCIEHQRGNRPGLEGAKGVTQTQTRSKRAPSVVKSSYCDRPDCFDALGKS